MGGEYHGRTINKLWKQQTSDRHAAEKCITQNVMERAGLPRTELPAAPHINGPHSQMYEAWFGMIDPPGDYSVFDMS